MPQLLQSEAFVIVLPPRSVTGYLRPGHALGAVQDTIIRYHRMKGDNTLYLLYRMLVSPRRSLWRSASTETGKSRHDWRDEFLSVWAFKETTDYQRQRG